MVLVRLSGEFGPHELKADLVALRFDLEGLAGAIGHGHKPHNLAVGKIALAGVDRHGLYACPLVCGDTVKDIEGKGKLGGDGLDILHFSFSVWKLVGTVDLVQLIVEGQDAFYDCSESE